MKHCQLQIGRLNSAQFARARTEHANESCAGRFKCRARQAAKFFLSSPKVRSPTDLASAAAHDDEHFATESWPPPPGGRIELRKMFDWLAPSVGRTRAKSSLENCSPSRTRRAPDDQHFRNQWPSSHHLGHRNAAQCSHFEFRTATKPPTHQIMPIMFRIGAPNAFASPGLGGTTLVRLTDASQSADGTIRTGAHSCRRRQKATVGRQITNQTTTTRSQKRI